MNQNPSANQAVRQKINAAEAQNMQTMNCRPEPSPGCQPHRPDHCHPEALIRHSSSRTAGSSSNKPMPCQGCGSCENSAPYYPGRPGEPPMPCPAGRPGNQPMSCPAGQPGMRPVFRPAKDASCSALMKQVYQTGFAVDDILLYLDTHPCDSAALAYYQQVQALYQNAVQAYESQYGPLFMTDVDDRNYWTWINEPWPWEGGCI